MSSYVILFVLAVLSAVLTTTIWYGKRNVIESAVLGIVWFFCSHVLASFGLFLVDGYTVFRTICLTLALDAAVLGTVIAVRRPKPFAWGGLFRCDFSLKPMLLPLCICLLALPFTLQKNEFFGMGQDQGVYQTQAILFLHEDTARQKNFEEYAVLDTAQQAEFLMAVRHKLGGYDIPSVDYPDTVYDRTVGDASGIIHGIPTHTALLTMWGELFGLEHMGDVETIFYCCLIFLVFCICRNLKLRPLSCALAALGTAFAPIVIWVSKAALTEMFLALLPALFLYIMTDRENRSTRWLSILPVAVFGCFHVSFYTMIPLFLMVYGGMYFFTREKQFAVLLPMTVVGYLASYFGMRHIQPVYTMNNYSPLFVGGINVHNITTAVVAASLAALAAVLLFVWLISRTNQKFYIMQNWNHRASRSRGFCIFLALLLLLPAAFIVLRAVLSYGRDWGAYNNLALLGFFGNAGLLLCPIALLVGICKPKLYARNNARLTVFLMFFYCILVYAAVLRFEIQYYYYYARYLAPFIAIAAVFAAMTLDRFDKKLLLPAAALGLLSVLPFDLYLLGHRDDTRMEWETLLDVAETAEDADCILVDNAYLQHFWMPLDAMTNAAVYPEGEDRTAQLAALAQQYETVLFVTEEEIPEEHFTILYRDRSHHSEDDLNHTGLLIPFSYRFWQTEDMVVVGQYDGIG